MSIRRLILLMLTFTATFPAAARIGQSNLKKSKSVTADSELSAPLPHPRVRESSPYLVNGFGVGGGLLNLTNNADVKVTIAGQSTPLDSGSRTGGSASLDLNYSFIQRMGFGVTSDVTYSQVQKIISDDAYGFIRPAVNVAFGGAEWFYTYAGVNYMSFVAQPVGKAGSPMDGVAIDLHTQVGWQAGIGATYGHLQGQLQYSTSKITVDQTSSYTSLGYSLPVHYNGAYDFSGVELLAQYRF